MLTYNMALAFDTKLASPLDKSDVDYWWWWWWAGAIKAERVWWWYFWVYIHDRLLGGGGVVLQCCACLPHCSPDNMQELVKLQDAIGGLGELEQEGGYGCHRGWRHG